MVSVPSSRTVPSSPAAGPLLAAAVGGAVVAANLVLAFLLAVLVPPEALVRDVLGLNVGLPGRTAAVATGGVFGNMSAVPLTVVGKVPAPGLAVATVLAAGLVGATLGRRVPAGRTRALWAAAGVLPALVAMLALGVLAGVLDDVDLSLRSIAVGTVLLVGLGAVAGVVLGMRRDERRGGPAAVPLLPPAAHRHALGLLPGAWALAALAAVATVVGFLNSLVVLLRTPLPDGAGGGRGIAVLDLVLALPDVAIGATSLMLMSESREVFFSLAPTTERFATEQIGDASSLPDGLFAVLGTLPVGIALLEVLLLLVVLVLAGLAAGFLGARRAGARTPAQRLVAGLLVGPLWLVIVPTLASLTGQGVTGLGRFVGPLLLGAVLGAAGALLSAAPFGPWRTAPVRVGAAAAPAPSPWSAREDAGWAPPRPAAPEPPPEPQRPGSLWGPEAPRAD